MLHWLDPIFPLNIIYNLINFSILIFLITFFSLKFKIKKVFLNLLILTSFFTLLINGPIMEWWQLPDQSKYLHETIALRSLNFDNLDGRIELFFPSLIFAFMPFPFIETFNHIGFFNRLIFSLLIIWLIRKKIDDIIIFYLILSPTLLLYTSSALKETLVIIFSILTIYTILEKKSLLFFIFNIFLLILKKQNALLILIFYLLNKYFFSFKYQFKKYFTFILSVLFFLLILFFESQILNAVNYFKFNFYHENIGTDFGFKPFENILDLIFNLPLSILFFLISPFPDITSPIKLLFFLDSLLIILFLSINYIKLIKKDQKQFFFWLVFFITFLSIYSVIVINDGTISRYKLSFFIPILFLINYLNKKINKKNEK